MLAWLLESHNRALNRAINGVKWVERQALQITVVNNVLKTKGKQLAESIGIILHSPEDPEWTVFDTRRVLTAYPKYPTLIHIQIHDDKEFFTRLVNCGTLGSGEAYMDDIWDEVYGGGEDISEVIKRISENNLFDLYRNYWNKGLEWVQLYSLNLHGNEKLKQEGKQQYDLGIDLYKLMLGPCMQYTCGYWAYTDDLDCAQLHKMDLIAKKLDLKNGMRVLEIGCSWGVICKFLAKKYHVNCVSVSNSQQVVTYAKKLCKDLPVEIRLQDYRNLDEKFDRIISIEIFQHVGLRNYRKLFEVADRCLKNDGIFLLQTIGRNHVNLPRSEPWLQTYIFPNLDLPSPEDITKETSDLFVIEDWHNFGLDYAKTLHAWRQNFIIGWPSIRHKYGDRFYRMWIYYLSSCRGVFLAKRAQLWQIVLSKDGLKRDYRAVR